LPLDSGYLTVGKDEDSVEPLPEGEVPFRQRLLAEHLPAQVQLVIFFWVSENKQVDLGLYFFRRMQGNLGRRIATSKPDILGIWETKNVNSPS
jgi:hypothetical protein